jgi:hypothetical protein
MEFFFSRADSAVLPIFLGAWPVEITDVPTFINQAYVIKSVVNPEHTCQGVSQANNQDWLYTCPTDQLATVLSTVKSVYHFDIAEEGQHYRDYLADLSDPHFAWKAVLKDLYGEMALQ